MNPGLEICADDHHGPRELTEWHFMPPDCHVEVGEVGKDEIFLWNGHTAVEAARPPCAGICAFPVEGGWPQPPSGVETRTPMQVKRLHKKSLFHSAR